MPLYEVVLRYADRDEVRWTDHDPRVNGYLRLLGRQWRIVTSREASTPSIARRFIVEPASSEELPA